MLVLHSKAVTCSDPWIKLSAAVLSRLTSGSLPFIRSPPHPNKFTRPSVSAAAAAAPRAETERGRGRERSTPWCSGSRTGSGTATPPSPTRPGSSRPQVRDPPPPGPDFPCCDSSSSAVRVPDCHATAAGGRLVYQYTKKRASGPKCPVTGKKIQGVISRPSPFQLETVELVWL